MRELIERLEGNELTEAISMRKINSAYMEWRAEIYKLGEALMKGLRKKVGESAFLALENCDADEERGREGYVNIRIELAPNTEEIPDDVGEWLKKQTGIRWEETSVRGSTYFEVTTRPSFR